jgi:hypothetical protein
MNLPTISDQGLATIAAVALVCFVIIAAVHAMAQWRSQRVLRRLATLCQRTLFGGRPPWADEVAPTGPMLPLTDEQRRQARAEALSIVTGNDPDLIDEALRDSGGEFPPEVEDAARSIHPRP